MKQCQWNAFNPQRPAFNDNQSNLSSFLYNQHGIKPANAASTPLPKRKPASADPTNASSPQSVCQNALPGARAHAQAIQNGSEKGSEFYTQLVRNAQNDEPDELVESRQISKEEFPQG